MQHPLGVVYCSYTLHCHKASCNRKGTVALDAFRRRISYPNSFSRAASRRQTVKPSMARVRSVMEG